MRTVARCFLVLVCGLSLLVCGCAPVWADNETETDVVQMMRHRFGAVIPGSYVAQGCLPTPTLPLASITLPAFACDGVIASNRADIPVHQDAMSVGPLSGGDGTYWVALHIDRTSTVSGWTRQRGTHYLWQKATTKPSVTDGALLAQVTIASGAITALGDFRVPVSLVRQGTYDVTDPLYGAVANDSTDLGPPLQKAINAASAQQGRTVRIPSGRYLLSSAVLLQGGSLGGVEVRGDGYAKPAIQARAVTNQSYKGTWIHINSTSFLPFEIKGTGVTMRDIAFDHDQPADAPGFTPTNYPYTIQITGWVNDATVQVLTFDTVLDNLFFYKATRGINQVSASALYPAGRIYIHRLAGQFFISAFRAEYLGDPLHLSEWHLWPFWSDSENVLRYSDINNVPIAIGFSVGGYITNVFSYSANKGIYLFTNSYGVTASLSVLGGSFDRTVFGFYSDQNGAVGNSLVNFHHDGLRDGANTYMLPGFADSSAVRIDGPNNSLDVVNLAAVVEGGPCVANLGVNSIVNVTNMYCNDFNITGANEGALKYTASGALGTIAGAITALTGHGSPTFNGTFTKASQPGGAYWNLTGTFGTLVSPNVNEIQFFNNAKLSYSLTAHQFALTGDTGAYLTGGAKKYLCIQDGFISVGTSCP